MIIEKSSFKGCTALHTKKVLEIQRLVDELAVPIYIYQGKQNEIIPTEVTKVIVHDSVIEIPDNLFRSRKQLREVILPKGLQIIGNMAFSYCERLTTVELPSEEEGGNLQSIGEEAFERCIVLEHINLPNSVVEIYPRAFQGCIALKTMALPRRLTIISENVFRNCLALESINIPSSIVNIGRSAINGCTSLSTVILNEGLQKIDTYAFSDCKALKSITIPLSVVTINVESFKGCSSLEQVTLQEGQLKMIFAGTFERCRALESITIPSSVVRIGARSFYGCESLTTVILHEGQLETIDDQAFGDCKALSVIEIPPTVKKGKFFKDSDQLNHYDLRNRFSYLPLHKLFYNRGGMVSMLELQDTLKMDTPDAVNVVDSCGMTAVHILAACGIISSAAVISLLINKYPKAVTETDISGRRPIYYVPTNRHLWENFPDAIKFFCTPESLVADKNGTFPLEVCIRHGMSTDLLLYMFSICPVEQSSLNDQDDMSKLKEIREQYIQNIMNMTTEEWKRQTTEEWKKLQHGWVEFANKLSQHKEDRERIVSFIKNQEKCPKEVVEALANAKDTTNRLAMDVADQELKQAMEDRLLFLGRYDLAKGHPIHISATCVVVKATDKKIDQYYGGHYDKYKKDHGEKWDESNFRNVLKKMAIQCDERLSQNYLRQFDLDFDNKISKQEFIEFCHHIFGELVALKFMKNKDQFERERNGRTDLDEEYVVGLIGEHESCKDNSFADAVRKYLPQNGIKKEDCDMNIEKGEDDYRYLLVMPYGDRNLDTIFRSERPDMISVRKYAMELGRAIQHLHEKKIIHGDIKLLNVVRFSERLRLIDLDSSCPISSTDEPSYAGNKFSSGVLPPEMIHFFQHNEEMDELQQYENCFAPPDNIRMKIADVWWEKIKPRINTNETLAYAVKTFRERKNSKPNLKGKMIEKTVPDSDGLPYKLIKAGPSIDIWSFGSVLYQLCTGKPLFKVNRDDDIVEFDELESLYEWNDSFKNTKLSSVQDAMARDLLGMLLEKDPTKRFPLGMSEVLEHPFFTLDRGSDFASLEKKVDELYQFCKKIYDNTVNITVTVDKLARQIERLPNIVCKAVFEATEVTTPTCFIVLPERIKGDKKEQQKQLQDFSSQLRNYGVVAYIKSVLCKEVQGIAKFLSKTLYLYLVDEKKMKVVCPEVGDRIYPLEIHTQDDDFKKWYPIVSYSLAAFSVGRAAVASTLSALHCIDANSILGAASDALDPLRDLVDGEGTTDTMVAKKTNRDKMTPFKIRKDQLQAFARFLKRKDPDRTFCKLRRVCDTTTGNAIWVTEESLRAMEDLQKGDSRDFLRLKGENERLRMKLQELERRLESSEPSSQGESEAPDVQRRCGPLFFGC